MSYLVRLLKGRPAATSARLTPVWATVRATPREGTSARSPGRPVLAGAASLVSAKESTSSLVILPPGPVPPTWPRSTPWSWATRWATGVAFLSLGAAVAACGCGAETGAGADGVAAGPPALMVSPATPIMASTSLTPTSEPSVWNCLSNTPLTGAVTSVSTLSVATSKITSPSLTDAPSAASQRLMVTSSIPSPRSGSFTSVAIVGFPCRVDGI